MLLWFIIYFMATMSMPFISSQQQKQQFYYDETDDLSKLLNLGLSNIIKGHLYSDEPRENATYDFIIVGAGPAGCVLANRLSENPKWSVYLIEAGGVEGVIHEAPALSAYLQGTHSNWAYESTPQKYACFGMNNQRCALPRGKVLGGTSSINYMIYNRGNKRDFDRWAAAGNKGWSYDEVLPYFLKSEHANLIGLENSPFHNHSGPLSVEDVTFRTDIVHGFIAGAQQAGHKRTDYNGETQMGVSYVQANTINGKRHSAFRAYIEPIRQMRKNLHILTLARVIRVLINPATKTAYGIKLHYGNRYFKILARKEVILSAGAFNSPQLLMLSGVGPVNNLKAIGIPLVKELPVGKRMYDHLCHFGPTFLTNTTGQTLFTSSINRRIFKSYFYGNPGTMLSSIGGVEALTFIKVPNSREPHDMPDVELITVAGSLASDEGTALAKGANFKQEIYDKVYRSLTNKKQDHFTFLIMQFHPKSVGHMWLHNRNPMARPRIDPKYLSNPDDIEVLLKGIKETIKIANTPAMKKLGVKLLDTPIPGCNNFIFASDDYWRCSIRTMSYTLHHQVATCRMGPVTDPTTVVNSELRVHGITNLRVADTSIIPFPPTAHTNAASFMIGEKAADMIRDYWFRRQTNKNCIN